MDQSSEKAELDLIARELESAASMLRQSSVYAAKILVGSMANSLRFHWCDVCLEYTKAVTYHDSADDRDVCERCAIEFQIKVTQS